MAHFDCNSTTNIWHLMESMVFTDCEPLRAMLNLRQDWSSRNEMRGRRTWSPCEIVRDSWFLAETSNIVRNMRGRKASLRFNASNDTHSRKQRRFIVLRTQRYVSLVEELLGDLLVKKSLYDTFHPTSLSTAIFFYAASVIRSLYPLFHWISGKSQNLREPVWQHLQRSLLDHLPLGPRTLPSEPRHCSLLSALHHLLKADNLRIEAGSDWSGASGMEIQKSLDSAQQQLACMLGQGGKLLQHFTFPKAFVFFHLLDRLDCHAVAAIKSEMLGKKYNMSTRTFWMHVMPAAHTESNHVRGKGFFHCGGDRFIHREVAKSRVDGGEFRFVEVGASLGGCSWTVLTSHPRSKALAIEAYKPAADAMRRTALENGLADRLMVFESFVSSNSTCPGRIRVFERHEFVDKDEVQRLTLTDLTGVLEYKCKTAALSSILQSWSNATVDLLRIHVDGFEMDVLRSLEKSWPKIQSLSLALWASRHFPRDYDPAAISQLLRDFGCDIELHFMVSPLDGRAYSLEALRNEAVIHALQRSEIRTPQTMTLLAFCGNKRCGRGFVNFFLTSLDRTWEDCTVWVERGVPNESKADILFHNWRNETEFKFKALIYLFSWFDTSIRNISYTVKGSLAAKLARYGCSKLETVTTVAKVVVERWAVASSSN